ncbi:hypothetical protein VTL71DRAFT_5402 [Oculimacula yallundae]|uniref:Uncharacterized protein n=1 Tax=Oculimacula yallundae TaxID=86028 RepID=A0ABR4C1L2_9HELO
MFRILLAPLIFALAFQSASATDPLGLCARSAPRSCSGNDLEQLFINTGPITTLNCNFTLSTTLNGNTMPYAINAFNPNNQLFPIPFSSFSPTYQNPVVKFSLTDRVIETMLAPYPDLQDGREVYEETLMMMKDPDKFGSSDTILMSEPGHLGLEVPVEGRMKWQCINGSVNLVLVAPDGKNFVTEAEAFRQRYPAPLLIDNAYLGRFFTSGGVYQKIDVVVHILYDE